jgi:iron-sulfur cluster assembly protein
MEETLQLGNATLAVSTDDTLPALSLTEAAIAHIKRLQSENDMGGFGLRYGLQGGGCSGYTYLLEFEEAPAEDDEVLEFEGVRVFMNSLHIAYLRGTTLDYSDSLIGAGFQIKNPNVKRQCGCGASFDV